MDFARKQLEKYGWTNGKGLGKHEDGISEALKTKMKRSVAGLGHDAAADFTEHWWTTLYDKAAGNVKVEEKNGKTKRIKTEAANFEITNSEWKLKRKKKDAIPEEEYSSFFVKKAILSNGGAKTEQCGPSDSDSDSEEEVKNKDALKLTDEELFAACGGRTAHKGARHGLKALGKLARIEQQEQLLLKEERFTGYSHKKKSKQTLDMQQVEDMNLNSDGDVTSKKSKKNKKKHCSRESIEAETEKCESDIKKKRKMAGTESENGESEVFEDDANKCNIKKAKKKHEIMEDDKSNSLDNDNKSIIEAEEKVSQKRKKKNKV